VAAIYCDIGRTKPNRNLLCGNGLCFFSVTVFVKDLSRIWLFEEHGMTPSVAARLTTLATVILTLALTSQRVTGRITIEASYQSGTNCDYTRSCTSLLAGASNARFGLNEKLTTI
jgi:hypothetical protein